MNADALADWLKARLVNPQAQKDWELLLTGAVERCLDSRLEALGPPAAVEALVLAHFNEVRAADVVRPMIRGFLHQSLIEARADEQPIGRWVPAEARSAIDELAARKGLIQEAWIKQIFAEKAVEELVGDTLYRALIDFSTLVPRIVQSLMPSALGRLTKLGGGVGGRVVEEVEKLLEAEVKKFMGRGTRLALDGAARFAADHIDDPVSIGTRRSLVQFALKQSGAFHAAPLSPEVEQIVERISLAIAGEVVKRDEAKAIARRVIERLHAAHGAGTVRAFLEAHGITERPPYAEWAAVTWPTVEAVLQAPEVDRWLRGLAGEILSQIGAAPGP